MATVSLDKLWELARNLHPKDCTLAQSWFRKTKFGRIKTVEAALAKATRELKPKARDWTSFLAFIKEVLPIIIALFSK